MNLREFLTKTLDRVTAKSYGGFFAGKLPQSPANWTGTDFLRALDISLYASRAVGIRAQNVGDTEFELRDAKGDVIENDPLLNLLYRPNPLFTGRQFWALWQTYYDCVGETYVYLETGQRTFTDPKSVTALHLLVPTNVTPKFGPDGMVTGYEYRNGAATTVYSPENVIYVHNPDPSSPLRGRSLLRAGVSAIQTESQISSYHARVLENGGKVEGVFKFKTPSLTRAQLSEMKDAYQKEYGSAKKAGLPLFLGGDADYVRTGLSPDELSYLEAKKVTLDDICIMTGVPRSMMGSTTDVKFDNADADRAIFLRETVKPLVRTLVTALDERLFPDGRNLGFRDMVPENRSERRQDVTTAAATNCMTVNEKRAALKDIGFDLEDVDGGDDVLVPFSLVPAGTEPAPQGEATKRVKSVVHPLRDPEVRAMYGRIMVKRLDAREKTFMAALTRYFMGQEKRITEALDPKKTRIFRKEGLIDEVLSIELEVKIGKESLLPLLTELLKQAGIDAAELAGSPDAFNLTSGIAGWLDSRAEIFLRQVNETTFEMLKRDFADSLAAQEGRDGLVRRIRDTYGEISKGRASLIARTEVHNATQYGTMEGYKAAGLAVKIWVTVEDSATRDSHAMQDGEERPIGIPFTNGLMFPGDPSGPPGETVNCRCTI